MVTRQENQRRAFVREFLDAFSIYEWSLRPGTTAAEDAQHRDLKMLRWAYGLGGL